MTALELVSITAGYGPYRALDDVTFSVAPGEAVALVGPNGAGKSTVARVCAGLVHPTSGRLLVRGEDLTGAPPWRIARAKLASVPEGRSVFAALSVAENLELSFTQWLGPAAARGALEAAYERFPVLYERRRQRAGTLSGGQQRLLSLAKVLGDAPEVVVADELSLGLSPAAVDDLYEQLAALHAAPTALVVIEQRTDRALQLAERAVVLDRGTVVYDGVAAGASGVLSEVLGAAGTFEPPVGTGDVAGRPPPT
jgi:branched-chain amino acid transport system ATP-binding protein